MDANELLEALIEAPYSDLCQAIVDKKGLRDGKAVIDVAAGRCHKLTWSEKLDLTPHNPRVDEVVDPNQMTLFEYDGDGMLYNDLTIEERIDWNFAIGDVATFIYSLLGVEYVGVTSTGQDYDEAENRIDIIHDQEADEVEARA